VYLFLVFVSMATRNQKIGTTIKCETTTDDHTGDTASGMTKLQLVISRLSSPSSLLLNLQESPRQSESGTGI
jgi:hypothetical protein